MQEFSRTLIEHEHVYINNKFIASPRKEGKFAINQKIEQKLLNYKKNSLNVNGKKSFFLTQNLGLIMLYLPLKKFLIMHKFTAKNHFLIDIKKLSFLLCIFSNFL
jgi:hypothetical protein